MTFFIVKSDVLIKYCVKDYAGRIFQLTHDQWLDYQDRLESVDIKFSVQN